MQRKIFIIEDDANILSSLKAKLSVEGFKVEVDSGTEELEAILNKIKIFSPEFIILDLILPQVDGFLILQKLKGDANFSHIPVFVFTNLSDSDTKSRSVKLGADFYFIKDELSLDDFINKIKKIIENKKL
jgi:DNA-binding response OmpR family regulator